MVILYFILSAIDWAVYNLASVMFSLIIELAKVRMFDDGKIATVANRIYIIVGVLMLFKLVISAIQYMVNPDSFDDKEKGLAGILKKTGISIALIALVPAIFDMLIQFQTPIIETLPKIVFGTNIDNQVEGEGRNIAFSVLSSFVTYNENNEDYIKLGQSGFESKLKREGKTIKDFGTFVSNVTAGCPTGLGILWGDTNKCYYSYMVLISTICGGFLCYVLLTMMLDVAIRIIKLGFIRLLAPIPIASYIVSKDKLSKFIKMTTTVYVDLFIRLLIIYFIIFALENITATGALNVLAIRDPNVHSVGDWFRKVLANIAIIVGLLMFASKAPKFISELLGLPDVGAGEMADMFKPAWQRAGGAAGALINPGANAIANYRQTRGVGGKRLEALRRAIAGFGKGALNAVEGTMAGDDWGKMRNRLDASKQKSLERAKRKQYKKTNKEDGEGRLERARKRLVELKNKIVFMNDPAIDKEAENRYNAKKAALEKMRQGIDNGIKNGTLKGEKLDRALEKYNNLRNELSDKSAFMQKEKRRIFAEMEIQKEVSLKMTDIKNNEVAMQEIDRKLNDTSLTDYERQKLLDDKLDIYNENARLEKEVESMTHEKEMKDNKVKIDTIDSQIAGARGDAELDAARDSLASIQATEQEKQTRLAEIDAILDDESLPITERRKLAEEKTILKSQIDTINAEIEETQGKVDARVEKLKEERKVAYDKNKELYEEKTVRVEKKVKEIIDIENQIDKLEDKDTGEIATIEKEIKLVKQGVKQSGWRSNVDSFFGGIPVSGKGYADLANLIGQTRSSIYTSEAMTKMRQNADILVDASGNPFEFKTKFADQPISYQAIADLKNRMESGNLTLTDPDLKKYGIKDFSMLRSAFEDVEKSAAQAYITATVYEIENPNHEPIPETINGKPNPKFIDNKIGGKAVVLKRHEINSAVQEMWMTFEKDLVKSGIPGDVIGDLKAAFRRNPGEFFKNGSSMKDLYSLIGKNIIDGQKPSDGGKK